MARLRATTTKNIKYYSIIEDYYRNGNPSLTVLDIKSSLGIEKPSFFII